MTNNSRKLVAALACRNGGRRLYGKPLQVLSDQVRIIDLILESMLRVTEIEEIILAIAVGEENLPFVQIAKQYGIRHIIGDEKNVLQRLIQCGELTGATDIFRVTSECPFIAWELFDIAWREHLTANNDITVTDYLPEGMNFEIYQLDVLLKSHRNGFDQERSEYCSAYARRNFHEFKIGIIAAPKEWQHLDYRLTVDNPEDLILCREVYKKFSENFPILPTDKIISYLNERGDLVKLVKKYVDETPLWAHTTDNIKKTCASNCPELVGIA